MNSPFNITEKAVERGLHELKAGLRPFRRTHPLRWNELNEGVEHHLRTVQGAIGVGVENSCSSFGLSCRLEASDERG
jgi:hypothetical protein